MDFRMLGSKDRNPYMPLYPFAFWGYVAGVVLVLALLTFRTFYPGAWNQSRLEGIYGYLFPARVLGLDIASRSKLDFFLQVSGFAFINGTLYALMGIAV